MVFYYVCRTGENLTLSDLAHPNAFNVSCQHGLEKDGLRLGDIRREFPLLCSVDTPLAFAFQTTINGSTQWLHLPRASDSTIVPVSASRGNKVFMKVVVPPGCSGFYVGNAHESGDYQRGATDEKTIYGHVNTQAHDGEYITSESSTSTSINKKQKTEGRRRRSHHRRPTPEPTNPSNDKKTSYTSVSHRQVGSRAVTKKMPVNDESISGQTSTRNSISVARDDRGRHESNDNGPNEASGTFFSILKSAAKTAGQAANRAASAIRSSVSSTSQIEFPCGITIQYDAEPFAEGGFGTVYRARDKIDSDYTFALKWMIAQERSHLEDAKWEIEVHRRVCGHPNIMGLIDHTIRPSERTQSRHAKDILLLYPLCQGGSIFDSITRASASNEGPWPFPEHIALTYFLEACEGAKHMHKQGLAHRDIKPHNILLFKSSQSGEDGKMRTAVLMDLGSAAPIPVQLENRRQALELQDECNSKCSPPYRAPELHEPDHGKVVDAKVDVFSLGATLYTMAFGHNPFEHPARGFEKLALLNGAVSFPESRCNKHGEKYSKGFCSLVKGMLRTDPARRTKLSRVIKKTIELLE